MKKLFLIIEFSLFYLKEVILSNIRVAHDVLTPTHHMNPQLVNVDLDHELSDVQLTILANLITMTPGTLSIDISENRRSLFIHAMFLESEKALIEEVNKNYVKRIINVF